MGHEERTDRGRVAAELAVDVDMQREPDQAEQAEADRDRIEPGACPKEGAADVLLLQRPGDLPEFLAGDGRREQAQRQRDAEANGRIGARDGQKTVALRRDRMPDRIDAACVMQGRDENDRRRHGVQQASRERTS